MTKIQKVVGTAFVVAEFRNDENTQAHPLYRDPYVHLFLDRETKEAADRISQSFPPIRNNVRLRTRYFDDRLRHQIDQGTPTDTHTGRRTRHKAAADRGRRRRLF